MKVLSLAWKYHPSVTSGVGVACEGLNKALSEIVDLTVIYPLVSKVKVNKETVLSSDDLDSDQKTRIEEEYIRLKNEKNIEIAVKLDPYFTSTQYKENPDTNNSKQENALNVFYNDNKPIYKLSEELLFEEVDVFGENVRDKIFLYNKLVEEHVENINFDVIHAHDWMTFLAGINLKNKYNKPLVLHVHSLEYDRVGHKDVSWVYDIERYSMSKADMVISPSNYTKGIIESNYGLSGNHIRTINNAITFSGFTIKNHTGIKGIFKILFAGRIDGNKGIEYFIEIARQVLQYTQQVEFVVVGRRDGHVNLENIDGYDEIKSKTHFLGYVERDDLFSLYQECDVLCMPSISEPFGLTAIEAAYVGLPVILSSNTGVSEVLPHALKADFWDIGKFARHILSIKENDKLRNRLIAKNKKDVAKLSWDYSAKKVLDLFNDLQNKTE